MLNYFYEGWGKLPKEKFKYLTVIGSLLGLCGVVIIFFSVNFGTSIAESWLVSRGGADTGYYHIIVNSYINSFLVTGGILFGFGLMIFTFAYYKLLIFKN